MSNSNPRRRIGWLVLSSLLALAVPSLASAEEPTAKKAHVKRYQIDHKEVTKAEFDAFLKTLHGEVDWSCAEKSTGGVTRYRAQDADGNWYQIREESGGDDESTATRIAK